MNGGVLSPLCGGYRLSFHFGPRLAEAARIKLTKLGRQIIAEQAAPHHQRRKAVGSAVDRSNTWTATSPTMATVAAIPMTHWAPIASASAPLPSIVIKLSPE